MSDKQTVAIPERFDYSSYRPFYAQCEQALNQVEVKFLVMDFTRTRYLDSAALGMLVQIHRKAQAKNVATQIANADGVVLETLTIANMSKLYEFI